MSNVIQMTNEIKSICTELKRASDAISLLEPVSFIKKDRLFSNGIIELIDEYRGHRKLKKLIEISIYKDFTILTFSEFIISEAQKLVELQLNIQSILSKDDQLYFENVELIFITVANTLKQWLDYCPEMEEIGYEEANTDFYTYTRQRVWDELKRMDHPEREEELVKDIGTVEKEQKGCINMLFIFLILGLSFGYGLHNYL